MNRPDPAAIPTRRDPLPYQLLVISGFTLGFIAGLVLAVYNVVHAWIGAS